MIRNIKVGHIYRTAYFEEQYIKITQLHSNPGKEDDEMQAKGDVYPDAFCRFDDRSYSTNVSPDYLVKEVSEELTPEEYL